MDVSFTRDAINATLTLFEKHGLGFEVGADELRKLRAFNLETPKSAFGASWRLANSANFLAGRVAEPLRTALLSTAFLGYEHCATGNDDFRRSRDETRASLAPSGPLAEPDILDAFAHALAEPYPPNPDQIAAPVVSASEPEYSNVALAHP